MATPGTRTDKASGAASAGATTLGMPSTSDMLAKSFRQRGYYSEMLSGADVEIIKDVPEASGVRRAAKFKKTPKASTFVEPKVAVGAAEAEAAARMDAASLSKSDVPPKALEPKVMLPYKHGLGKTPRKIEIERRKRTFASQSIESLIAELGIDADELLPATTSVAGVAVSSTFLPLEVFDNTDNECRTAEEWVDLGKENGAMKGVPGKTILRDESTGAVAWKECRMLKHDAATGRFLVQLTGREKQLWVPRIQLLFLAEDPSLFARRIADAHAQRKEAEARLRYELYIDCMPTDDIPPMRAEQIKRIIAGTLTTKELKKPRYEERAARLAREAEIDYARTMSKIIFDVTVDGRDDYAHISVPRSALDVVPARGTVDVPRYRFYDQRGEFLFNSFLTKGEVITAIMKVRAECGRAMAMTLFNLNVSKSVRLDEFEQMQTQSYSQVQTFLRETWLLSLKNLIRNSLRDVGKGWFNMNEKNKEVYEISKLQRFMTMVKFAMQDSLRSMVQGSLQAFTRMFVRGAESAADGVVWTGADLTQSPVKTKRNPLFLLDLVANKSGFRYSTPLAHFENAVLTVFDKAIASTQSLPQLEQLVMEDLFWANTPILESVNEGEPDVQALRNTIRATIRQSLVPLQEYARGYDRYLEFFNLDPTDYIRRFEAANHTVEEFRAEIELHSTEKETIEASIPQHISIGLFWVNCESVRSQMSKKRKDLGKAVTDLLSRVMRQRADRILGDFKNISRKLFERPNSIEDLDEQKEYMKTIPDAVRLIQKEVDTLLGDYEILDGFNCNLASDDFDAKWSAFGGPRRIEQQMEQTYEVLDKDAERFQKNLMADQGEFEENLMQLDMVVAGFSSHGDINKAQEIAAEVRKIAKQLKDCQNKATVFNNRERLFNLETTPYDKLAKVVRDFEPYKNLWLTTADWLKWNDSWLHDPFLQLDPEAVESSLNGALKVMYKSVKQFKDVPGCLAVASNVKAQMEAFKPYVPLIQSLRNPGMRERHWEQLSTQLGFSVKPTEELTFSGCLDMRLQDHVAVISRVAEVAGKEYSIEAALDKMLSEWEGVNLDIMAYRDTGTCIMRGSEEPSQLLDDHIVMTQSMSFSPYKKPFEERIAQWEARLKLVQDVLEEWMACQRTWLYLEPIFSSEDINRQLPTESKRYQTVDRIWRKILAGAKANSNVISLCPDPAMLESFRECNKLLELVQKGLSEYLETKRAAFPRFYFLSDDELLQILSQTKDPKAVQPHLRKCFENIAKLEFQDDLKITAMFSGEGERVQFSGELYPTGNVEEWLLEVEKTMIRSLKHIIQEALDAYPEEERTDWVLRWPGQVVIAGSQTYWAAQVTAAIEEGTAGVQELHRELLDQLQGLVELVRGRLNRIARMVLSALIVIDVHSRDVVSKLIEENVTSSNDFDWISQLRYYWEEENLLIRAVNAEFQYGYEYLGNTGRLVITPLTDRCYLTLTGALHLNMGGAPAGPAGTGKTESVKDLAKALAKQCVVFNCSDQLDFLAMGKFFKGLASAGAWSCFDEFNRIDIEVLSVIAQQITTIQKALQAKVDRFVFEGVEIALDPTFAVFITMNPGYAGRTELPDNLKALFRPVAMMVPDYALIAEISLFSFGFSKAKALAGKIVSTFKLSSEQLSSQDHYDFGMRAVKTVISAAGNLKREDTDMSEELILLRALRDVNVPKFLADDLILFNGIISDLFPGITEARIDYGALEASIRESCEAMGLDAVDKFVGKCIQLYETTVVRHGLMLVGPTGSGKTACYRVLKNALTRLAGTQAPSGAQYQTVHTYVLNPKSITMGQLYGEFDALTHEWTDGILSALVRRGVDDTTPDKKWYMFDGPVDAIWIENMNTVLDDNKKLCLSSGEIIKLTDTMTMCFEVEDLAVASPATVSRCGMVYLEPSILGLAPFVRCWLLRLPERLSAHRDALQALFDGHLEESLRFVRTSVRETLASVDSNLTFSLMNILDCLFKPFIPTNETEEATVRPAEVFAAHVEPFFFFALVWSLGATCDADGRELFSKFLRDRMRATACKLQFPEGGTVYDYRLSEDGEPPRWIGWMEGTPEFTVAPRTQFADIIVPTVDTVRYSHLLDMLVRSGKQVLCVGPTGTGKTLSVSDKLSNNLPPEYISHFCVFSARTSANQTQDIIDAKLDKRRKGVFAPPLGKRFVIFIDDLNMPALEKYGAQPPIELLRQWMDHGGWYDRKAIGSFREIVDVGFVCAMGPPGGGRNPVTKRLTRHFNLLAFTEMSDASKERIFATILGSFLTGFPDASQHTKTIVGATISVYNTITTQLLPTPAKSHYTFNLRDLSKVFQGLLMADLGQLDGPTGLLRLWVHECCRVFRDRLVNDEDRTWFSDLLKTNMRKSFGMSWEDVVPHEPLLYGDFMSQAADSKTYGEMPDFPRLVKTLEEYLDDFNAANTAQMRLVLFRDAIEHVARISRIIRQPRGNALLLGVGGSGRQSLTRLATFMADYELVQIELSKNYGLNEWREDLKRLLIRSGVDGHSVVFLFTDTQIKHESFLEDINNILNSGDVPTLFSNDDFDNICNSIRTAAIDSGIQPTKANLLSFYFRRVRTNLHLVLCMSPLGEVFRARLRMFPALVNCTTIDWFSAWPDEALRSVAASFLSDIADIDYEKVGPGLVDTCVGIHQSVVLRSKLYLAELNRHNYVTPTSYLELLGIFAVLLGKRRTEVNGHRNRTATGLEKLLTTATEVELLQQELQTMQPMLEQAARDTLETMEKIARDKVIAEETRVVVGKEEKQAQEKAEETKAIASDAQKDLDEALPALDAALASLKSLNKNDVVEMRSMQRPPAGVKLVMEAVCIMKGVKPKKVEGSKPGQKVDDYWEAGRGLLADPQRFLESLFRFDKDNISDPVIQKIQPYIDSEEFQPAVIAKVSKACTSICQWVRAMHKYHFVSKSVAPKRARLEAAQESLQETLRVLNDAKMRLHEVEMNISELEKKYAESVAKKNELTRKCEECSTKLDRAKKLIGALGDEKSRWEETVKDLDRKLVNIVGDIVVAAGTIAYLSPFTAEYRAMLVGEWHANLVRLQVPHTPGVTLVGTLSDPVRLRQWQIAGLPRDSLSIENGVVVSSSRRWPLFIDPQGQANKWIKNLEKDQGLDVVKLTDRDFLRSLENAVRFGKPCLLENVGEELDPALEPILLRQTFKQAGSTVIKIGDAIIPYHDDFKLYITTTLSNPHYTPEVSVKVTLVNFTLAPSGLEDQLLALVVAEERPDLEDAKNQLIVSNAKMQQELKAIEDEILFLLSSVQGSPVDDERLIDTLQASKKTSEEIKTKVMHAERTEKDIDATRSKYIPVAVRVRILFFCITDLAMVDPMYQYSLSWFVNLFLAGIANAEKSDDLEQRITNIKEFFTFSLYANVCRSLFEKHKLLFSFLLCGRILMDDGKIDMLEWRFLTAGGTSSKELLPSPASWLSDRAWAEVLGLSTLPSFSKIAREFYDNLDGFKRVFDSPNPYRETLPGKWCQTLDGFQRMLVLRCLRPDKITNAMQDFVADHLGQQFIEPQSADLAVVFKDSSPSTPLIFVLSPGTDPANNLYKLAEEMRFSKKLSSVSLGQGQGPRAEAMMREAMERGHWIFFQNCHLAPSWMPSLERLIEGIAPDKVHRDFRIWLTSMPSPSFPVSVLQNGVKMTVEPPRGIKANLMRSYNGFNDAFLESCDKHTADVWKKLLFSLCFFHGGIIERRKFGALGFNIPYEFTDGDLRICVSQLRMFLNEYDEIPYKVLRYTAGHINYGGRVTDDWDRRTVMNILNDYYASDVLRDQHLFSASEVHVQPASTNHKGYVGFIRGLPINDAPEIFGLHANADITFAQNETYRMLGEIMAMQPKSAAAGGRTREEVVGDIANDILARLPLPMSLEAVVKAHPVRYEESMNTVLIQEVIRYNRLLAVIHESLQDMLKALKGLVVMSSLLESVLGSIFNNQVPELWAAKAYPSLKPLASWVTDLLERIRFITTWRDAGIPKVFWISGFFFPQAFLTGTLQNFARKYVVSIDSISFDFKVMRGNEADIRDPPQDGSYVRGLFLEGARWDAETNGLAESRPKELYTELPIIWLLPVVKRKKPESGFYECPVYKTLTRAGTLSTTGHSTNYVLSIELPSSLPQKHWIQRGVALLCALNY